MDNPRVLVVRHDAVSRSVQFNDKLIAFAKHWRFRPHACAPYRARTKGKTENRVGYVKKNAIARAGRQAMRPASSLIGRIVDVLELLPSSEPPLQSSSLSSVFEAHVAEW